MITLEACVMQFSMQKHQYIISLRQVSIGATLEALQMQLLEKHRQQA